MPAPTFSHGRPPWLRSSPYDAAFDRLRDRNAITELLELLRRAYVTDQRDLMHLDQQIHRLVYRTAHNAFLEATLERYFNLSLRLWYLVLDRQVRLREAVDEHVQLLEAILSGDGELAETIMRKHVIGFEREIRRVLVET